ncbi:MAG: hypothetical protein U1F59_00505 [Candidatus Competibacteraceae bacterium]
MFVLTRRSALPRLQFVPGGLVRWHDGRVTLLPLTTAPGPTVEFSVETGAAGGCGIVLKIPDRPNEVVACYPSRRSARRQLRRLVGDAGWSAAGGLGRGLLLTAVLFVAWFLFFVPSDLSALQTATLEGNGAGAGSPPPALVEPAVSSLAHPSTAYLPAVAHADGPAFVDDPADPATAPTAPDAAPALAR